MKTTDPLVMRAQGCLLGQLAGDALGSQVEFRTAETIRRLYLEGVRDLAGSGRWRTLPGQPTDDSEMALLLARMLAELGCYNPDAAMERYRYWLRSGPFDCGQTIGLALHHGVVNEDSQANGALMRISPLGIFGARRPLADVALWAGQDASLTHPHAVCRQANALYAMAIAHAIRTGPEPPQLYEAIHAWAGSMEVEQTLFNAVKEAAHEPPADFVTQQGWVLIAFQNALWQLLHASSLEEGVIDTVMRGGDTDTTAAICGALLGAVYGLDAIPARWTKTILNCRPQAGAPGVRQPRPECFWPVDALELAEKLVSHATVACNA